MTQTVKYKHLLDWSKTISLFMHFRNVTPKIAMTELQNAMKHPNRYYTIWPTRQKAKYYYRIKWINSKQKYQIEKIVVD